MAFNDNLRRIRKEKGFVNGKDFAVRILGIKYTTYNSYERLNRLPSEEVMVKIAKALDVSIDDLFGYNFKAQKTDLDFVVKELNDLGIKSVINNNQGKVDVYISKNEKFASIPSDKMIGIVKKANANEFSQHIVYSHVMKDIIQCVDDLVV